MNPGPAPTLLDEWVTADAFWAFIALTAFAVVVWMAAEFTKRMRQDEQPAPKPHVVNWCDRNGHTYTRVVYPRIGPWRCTHCGHLPNEQVYDQELDTVDLALWELEQ